MSTYAVPLTGDEQAIANLRAALHIAEQRATWGTKKQRAEYEAKAADYRARLAGYGVTA